jgi:hypothetical protein
LSLKLVPRMLATVLVVAAARDVVGAEEVHRILRGWLARLGHEAYAEVVRA